jgi:hypothetical protein
LVQNNKKNSAFAETVASIKYSKVYLLVSS